MRQSRQKLSYETFILLSRKVDSVRIVSMEIASLPKASLRIKGKYAQVIVNPSGKHDGNAGLFLNDAIESHYSTVDGVVIASPGEYEVGGLKIRGSRSDSHSTYSLLVDGVDILLGKLSAFEKIHGKLSEHAMVIIDADTVADVSFATALASNVLIITGEKAQEVTSTFVKENVKNMSKYVVTKDKLPQEVETIQLSA
ncbi:MAG: hypothetical protein RLZZ455_790 [Candidatus Parcubacteria bacterium]